MKLMTFCVTSLKELTTSAASLPFSPATRMPQPKNSAITMIWSIEESSSGWMKFDGKMPLTVSTMLAFFASYAASSAISSTRNEPLKMFATTRPMTQAMAVVARK